MALSHGHIAYAASTSLSHLWIDDILSRNIKLHNKYLETLAKNCMAWRNNVGYLYHYWDRYKHDDDDFGFHDNLFAWMKILVNRSLTS